MAEENNQEKTEEPTSRRLEKAREEGQTPRSKELSTTLVLVLGAVGLLAFGPFMTERVIGIAKHSFSFSRETAYDTGMATSYLMSSIYEAAVALAPWLALVLFAAFAGP
ncbi:MAG TPA: flagellar biosynthetic protein FlhB, partial [Oceanospirillales bacterium]|nr:flagellar biosynthetic protein FlhB [Oceanospirillales bacterium]